MALVRPLYVDATEGLPVEIHTTDSIDQIAGLTVDGDIQFVGVTNPNGSVLGLPNPPPAADAAASKAYVDSVASGLDPKGNARIATTANLAWTAAGAGVGKTLTSTTNALSNNDFDGVTAALNDRILVKDETTGADNGIYEVTQLADGSSVPTVLTRATDADTDAEVTAGMFLFVAEGATQADTGWLLITNDPIVVDTTSLAFSQFAGAGSFSGGAGIDITGNVVSADLAATPGLEFDVGGNGGKLRVLVDPAGAVLRGAAGLAVNQGDGLAITANTLDVDLAAVTPSLSFDGGGGLQVDVDPAFAILKSATGLKVSVDGTSIQIVGNQLQAVSNPAARLEEVVTAQENLSNGDPIEWGTVNDQVRQCQAGVTSRIDCFGVVESAGGIASGGTGTIVRRGVATGILTAATVGQRFFVASTGGLQQGIGGLASGDWIIAVGTAKNATDLEVRPQIVARKA